VFIGDWLKKTENVLTGRAAASQNVPHELNSLEVDIVAWAGLV
jgi:hypothetical protein